MGNAQLTRESIHSIVGEYIYKSNVCDIKTYCVLANCERITIFIKHLLQKNLSSSDVRHIHNIIYESHNDDMTTANCILTETEALNIAQFYVLILHLYCVIKTSIERYIIENTDKSKEKIIILASILNKVFVLDLIHYKLNPLLTFRDLKNHLEKTINLIHN